MIVVFPDHTHYFSFVNEIDVMRLEELRANIKCVLSTHFILALKSSQYCALSIIKIGATRTTVYLVVLIAQLLCRPVPIVSFNPTWGGEINIF